MTAPASRSRRPKRHLPTESRPNDRLEGRNVPRADIQPTQGVLVETGYGGPVNKIRAGAKTARAGKSRGTHKKNFDNGQEVPTSTAQDRDSRMPSHHETLTPLKLWRHEAFAQGVAAGLSATRAYAQAYGRKSDPATRASAARLLANVNIQRRIAELRDAAAREAEACLSKLVPLLESAATDQIMRGHLGSASKALQRLEMIAKGSSRTPSACSPDHGVRTSGR
jgi:hypothetical protein